MRDVQSVSRLKVSKSYGFLIRNYRTECNKLFIRGLDNCSRIFGSSPVGRTCVHYSPVADDKLVTLSPLISVINQKVDPEKEKEQSFDFIFKVSLSNLLNLLPSRPRRRKSVAFTFSMLTLTEEVPFDYVTSLSTPTSFSSYASEKQDYKPAEERHMRVAWHLSTSE
ncbi:hypothetical protein TNCV_3752381 [Trichonephila clavipes]|nr:hypothetical protein TNCV_3752381 [Trichonephila clavipes]